MESLTEQMLKRDSQTLDKLAHTLFVKVIDDQGHILFLTLVEMASVTSV